MRNYWILVADGERARLLSRSNENSGVALLRDFISQSESSTGAGEAPRTFAANLGSLLEEAAVRHGFQRLVLVAADDFLPLLSAALGPVSTHRLAWSVSRNMTGAKLSRLEALLDELLGASAAGAVS